MKTRQEAVSFCLTLPDTYADAPFHDANWTLVRCRQNGKVFAWIFKRQGNMWINVKTDPEWRDFWRNAFKAVVPAYHLNKEHWNSIILDGSVPDKDVRRMISDSYDLVKPKKKGRQGKI